jgi:hypothetical protein
VYQNIQVKNRVNYCYEKISLPFTLIFVTLIGTPNLHNAVAHTFSGDESASFLALVEMIKIEAHLSDN